MLLLLGFALFYIPGVFVKHNNITTFCKQNNYYYFEEGYKQMLLFKLFDNEVNAQKESLKKSSENRSNDLDKLRVNDSGYNEGTTIYGKTFTVGIE